MTYEAMREAHERLMDIHSEMAHAFCEACDDRLSELLGKYKDDLSNQVRTHGDGYSLRAVPARFEEISPIEDVVLMVWLFPYLDTSSIFDPHRALEGIPYWKQFLSSKKYTVDGIERQCRFLIWQDHSPVHGEGQDDASCKEKQLCSKIPGLRSLIDAQAGASRQLLSTWSAWIEQSEPSRRLIVVPDKRVAMSESRIPDLENYAIPPIDLSRSIRSGRRLADIVEERLDQSADS